MIQEAIAKLVDGHDLTEEEAGGARVAKHGNRALEEAERDSGSTMLWKDYVASRQQGEVRA